MSSRGPGGGFLPAWGVVALGALLVAVAGLAAYSLVQFWPPPPPEGQTFPPATADVMWLLWNLPGIPRDRVYFIVVVSGGALGASVHALRSLSWYVGNRRMQQSWAPRLVLQPIIGALLALVAYLVVRAGLVSGPLSTDAVSPFGFAALAALIGLFTDQAIVKLKAVFETLLAAAPQGEDRAPGPAIEGLSVTSGAPGTELHIRGSNLGQVSEVLFDIVSVKPIAVSEGEVTIQVPAGATTGPVTVVAPAGRATSSQSFEVT